MKFQAGDKVEVAVGSDIGRVGIIMAKECQFPDRAVIQTWHFNETTDSELFRFSTKLQKLVFCGGVNNLGSGIVAKNEQRWYTVEFPGQEAASYKESWLKKYFEPPSQEWLDWLERSSI